LALVFVIKLDLDEQTLQKLKQLTGTACYNFLGFTLDLEKNSIKDNIGSATIKNMSEWHIQLLSTLLSHYASANPTPLTGKLVKYRDIPGGYAYEGAFIKRALQPIAEVFCEKPEDLPKAAELLGGAQCNLGDYSAQIMALAGIPLTYILWVAEDLPASASILYDSSASCFLPTEDLAALGEITTIRLVETKKVSDRII
jgi:hypothetical protein